MIENNYNNKINFEGKKYRKTQDNIAYDKLLSYRETVKKSDMCNSQTRYSKELEYIQEAIDEAQAKNQSDLVKSLEKSKNKVLKMLKKITTSEDKTSKKFILPYFVQKPHKEKEVFLSDPHKEIYDNFTEEDIIKFDKIQKKYDLSDDNTIAYMLFDDKQLEKFNRIITKHKKFDPDYAIQIAQFDEEQNKLFKHAIKDLGLDPYNATDFVTMYAPINPSTKAMSLEYVLMPHKELKDVLSDNIKEDITFLAMCGVDVPSMLDADGESEHLWMSDIGSLTSNVTRDIEKLAQAYKNINYPPDVISAFSDNKVISKEIKNKIKDVFVPVIKNQKELNELEMGDVFRTIDDKGKEKLFIVKDIDKNQCVPYELNISPDTYLKLFPPILRYSSVQGDSAKDCFLVTTLNILFDDKRTRKDLLDKFIEYPNGEIGIKLDDEIKYICDPEDERLLADSFLSGAPGMQMLEVAYGANMILENIEDEVEVRWKNLIESCEDRIEALEEKIALTNNPSKIAKYEEQIKKIKKEIDDIDYDAIRDEADFSKICNFKKNTSLRNKGGSLAKACIYLDLPYNVSSYYFSDGVVGRSLLDPNFKCYMGTIGKSDETYLDKDLGIVEDHAYMLMYKDGNFYAVNPWLSAQQIKIPKSKLDEYIDMIYYVS